MCQSFWITDEPCGPNLFAGEDEEFLFEHFEYMLDDTSNLQEMYYDGYYWTLQRVYLGYPIEYALISPKTSIIHLYMRIASGQPSGESMPDSFKGVSYNDKRNMGGFYFKAVPNPFKNNLDVQLSSMIEGEGLVEIHNVNGQLVHRERVSVRKGGNSFKLQLSNDMRPSMYFLTFKNAVGKRSVPIIKIE